MNGFVLITYIDRINFFSDFFIKYYLNFFSKNEFRFIILESQKDIIENYLNLNGFELNQFIYYNSDTFGFGGVVKKQNEVQKKYCEENYFVVWSDIDELIFHSDLKNYIKNSDERLFRARGLVLYQDKNEEKFNKFNNLFENRCKMFVSKWYSKICILKDSFDWEPGRHNFPEDTKISENLYLIDIGNICKHIMLNNNIETKKIYRNVKKRYELSTIEEIDAYFENNIYKSTNNFIDVPNIFIENKQYFSL